MLHCRWHPEGIEAEPAPVGKDIASAAVRDTEFSAVEPQFSDSFDARPEQPRGVHRQSGGVKPFQRHPASADLKIPELLDETGPSFFDHASEQNPEPRARKVDNHCAVNTQYM